MSLMMSSCCTFRLKRRRAFSIDSPSWTLISAKKLHPLTLSGFVKSKNHPARNAQDASHALGQCQANSIVLLEDTVKRRPRGRGGRRPVATIAGTISRSCVGVRSDSGLGRNARCHGAVVAGHVFERDAARKPGEH